MDPYVQVQRQLNSIPESSYQQLFETLLQVVCRTSDRCAAALLALAVALASLVVQWHHWDGALETLSASLCILYLVSSCMQSS
jgi:streptomycin 6-kinase